MLAAVMGILLVEVWREFAGDAQLIAQNLRIPPEYARKRLIFVHKLHIFANLATLVR
jgi:hypothetical protein